MGEATDAVISMFSAPTPSAPSGKSLKASVGDLKSSIVNAYKEAMTHGAATDALGAATNAEAYIEKLGDAIATAVHTYFQEAWVNVTPVVSTAPAGVPCLTVGPAVGHVGTLIAPVVTMHSGFGFLQ
jgi:hypothetical protein